MWRKQFDDLLEGDRFFDLNDPILRLRLGLRLIER